MAGQESVSLVLVLRHSIKNYCTCTRVYSVLQGYVRQGYCHACLDQNREAVRAFGEGLKRAESDEDKTSVLSQIISLSVNLAG